MQEKCGAYIYACVYMNLFLTFYSFWLQLLINLQVWWSPLGGFENKRGGMAFGLRVIILTDLHELILFYKNFLCFGLLVWFWFSFLFVWLIFCVSLVNFELPQRPYLVINSSQLLLIYFLCVIFQKRIKLYLDLCSARKSQKHKNRKANTKENT